MYKVHYALAVPCGDRKVMDYFQQIVSNPLENIRIYKTVRDALNNKVDKTCDKTDKTIWLITLNVPIDYIDKRLEQGSAIINDNGVVFCGLVPIDYVYSVIPF